MRAVLGRIFYFCTLLSLEHDLPTELFPGASRRGSLSYDLKVPGPVAVKSWTDDVRRSIMNFLWRELVKSENSNLIIYGNIRFS